jgi:autophagy-related protein 18
MEEDQVLVTFSRHKKKMCLSKNGFLKCFELFQQEKTLKFFQFCEDIPGFFSIVEIYEESDILFLVGTGCEPISSQRILTVFQCRSFQVVCEILFQYKIRAVRSNLTRVVVLIEDQAIVMKTESFIQIATVKVFGQLNLIEISANVEFCFMVFPKSEEKGYVGVFDCFNAAPVMNFSCHKTVIASLALSDNGKVLATASIKGTIIRVFECITGDLLYQFKRGMSPACVYEIQFFNQDQKIFVTSSTGKLHLFNLVKIEESQGFKSVLASWLPENCSDHLKSARSLSVFSTGFQEKFSFGWTEDFLILVSEKGDFLVLGKKEKLEKVSEGKIEDFFSVGNVN